MDEDTSVTENGRIRVGDVVSFNHDKDLGFKVSSINISGEMIKLEGMAGEYNQGLFISK